MPAYVISEVEVIDEALADRYQHLEATSIARHGGHYLVRGALPRLPARDQPDIPEDDWLGHRHVVIVEFPSMKQLQEWYASADYAEARAIAVDALRRRLLFVDGVEQSPTS